VAQTAFLRGYDLDADVPIHQVEQDITHLATSRHLLPLQPGLALSPTIEIKGFCSSSNSATGSATRYQTIGNLTMAGFAEAKLAIDLRLAGTGIATEEWHAPRTSQPTQAGLSVETDHETHETQSFSLLRPRRMVPSPEKREKSGETQDKAATMTSLLDQWQPGIDPSTYSWPGLTSHSTGTRIQREAEEATPTPRNLAERAPALEPSTQPQSLAQRRQLVAPASSQSQGIEELASTQILPGPFANRQPLSFRRGPNKIRTVGF
jgi:hypothetical protein